MRTKSVHKIINRIAVEKDAFVYLEGLSREQRGCKPLNDEMMERIWKKKEKTPDGLVILDDESLGGGDGTYYGKWISWRCNDLKRILMEKGYTWKDLPKSEYDCIEVSI